MGGTPNPGSRDAVALGCTCPVMDNNGGEGVALIGERLFWFTEGCPLHAPKKKEPMPVNGEDHED